MTGFICFSQEHNKVWHLCVLCVILCQAVNCFIVKIKRKIDQTQDGVKIELFVSRDIISVP